MKLGLWRKMGLARRLMFVYSRNMENTFDTLPFVTDPSAEEAATAFAALGSEARLTVLRILVRAGTDGLTVGQIQEALEMAASTLSHHLRALVQAGLIEQTREGRTLICRARFDDVRALAAFLVRECCADVEESACDAA